MLIPVVQGFMVGASLIMPIGVQNAYVLSRGIRRQHHLLVASLCLFCDLVLITLVRLLEARLTRYLPR